MSSIRPCIDFIRSRQTSIVVWSCSFTKTQWTCMSVSLPCDST